MAHQQPNNPSAPQGTEDTKQYGFAGKLAALFIDSKLTLVAIIASILLGAFAVVMLPREEEPQIKVPMIDVLVSMPGRSAEEVENRATRPMEQLLWEIPDVEYIYSTSSPGGSMTIVRFEVGTQIEDALIRLNEKLRANFDRIPQGVSHPLVKPRTIDDVPILSLTLHSKTQDHFNLRRLAADLADEIKSLPNIAEGMIIGGQRRALRVELDPSALAAHNLSLQELVPMLQSANHRIQAGSLPFANSEFLIETGDFIRNAAELESVVVSASPGGVVYLRDIASIYDGPEEATDYVLFGYGGGLQEREAAVTLSFAKRPGTNAIHVVDSVMDKLASLEGRLLPEDVNLTVTRDYGFTAKEKSDELLLHMGIAIFGVALLILFFLGWRESIVVLLAIPSTLALTLLVFYLYGYTLNRITLFALIFSIGILVDDAIVVVENIVRHVRLPSSRHKSLVQIALDAVDEVGNPTVLATWAVIAAILPMAFVGGLMGPYMRPIPVGASAAMIFSMIVAFTVTPWAAIRVLGRHLRKTREKTAKAAEAAAKDPSTEAPGDPDDEMPNDWFTRVYHWIMDPLLDRPIVRWAFLGGLMLLLLGAMALIPLGKVTVKMLPFDNKSEFQVILNMPEGSTLEQTAKVAIEMADSLALEETVRDYQIYVGTASPFNFNGLVRHYFMRSGPNVADIQVNLVEKHERSLQSHDIALRVRPALAEIAERHGATLAVAEVPPGPPVLQTLVAEIYGPTDEDRLALARAIRNIMEETEGVVDVDWYVEELMPKIHYRVDRDKAALHGLNEQLVGQTIAMAVNGHQIDLLNSPSEREDVPIRIELPRGFRNNPEAFLDLPIRSPHRPESSLIPLRELVHIEESLGERNRYRKNLKPVTYVLADVAGGSESPAYSIIEMNRVIAQLNAADFGGVDGPIGIYNAVQPFDHHQPSIKWDGEWHITLEVFRDLGIAFAAVLILIFMLMVGWFKSYVTPFVVMAAIPFSLIGILPAHWGMGAFFTATSMIGFMAGAGIVVRNSIILVDFIELRVAHGRPLRDAVVEAGAVRFRPMLLTALAVVVTASVILFDPIFQGLAISLLFGEIASLLLSRMAVPVLYYMSKS
ncbi:MAG: efflux RND transporter permease subunit [Opitutales bacterium]|nr:efflux RND transporter permease subunit [Opitutales bacterium]